jgi:hypothetical protein
MTEHAAHDDFTKLVLSKALPGKFSPIAQYIADDDSLEVIVNSETYKAVKADGDPSVRVYVGRDTGDVVGIRIPRIKNRLKEMPGDIHFVVENGRMKVAHFLREMRTTLRDKKPLLTIFIKKVEEAVPETMEAELCGAGY